MPTLLLRFKTLPDACEFEETVLAIVEEPLLKLATLVSAISRGILAFLRFFLSPAAE
jgi:hypothetical protein